jgi:hypothetical protein
MVFIAAHSNLANLANYQLGVKFRYALGPQLELEILYLASLDLNAGVEPDELCNAERIPRHCVPYILHLVAPIGG